MKKAQTEMIGLVVVVVLVTIAIFFSQTLKKPESSQEAAATYTEEELAGNYMIVLLEATPDDSCTAPTIKELSVDCIREQENQAPMYACGTDDQTRCDYLETIITDITGKTLDQWGYDYELSFTYLETSGPLFTIGADTCAGDTERSAPGLQFISLYPYGIKGESTQAEDTIKGSALFTLQLC